jgi:hypothetical protein
VALRPRFLLLPSFLAVALAASAAFFAVSAPAASTRGAGYAFVGGTRGERTQVQKALATSSFDWSIIPRQITIHIELGVESRAVPGEIWLDARLLDSGRFSWGVVQHEYAHQVDFFLLRDANHAELMRMSGGKAWCWDTPGLQHSDYGCERFASTLAWAYWQSNENCMKPVSKSDESAGMTPAGFRALLARMLNRPALRRAG